MSGAIHASSCFSRGTKTHTEVVLLTLAPLRLGSTRFLATQKRAKKDIPRKHRLIFHSYSESVQIRLVDDKDFIKQYLIGS